jgi:hypothetical protein
MNGRKLTTLRLRTAGCSAIQDEGESGNGEVLHSCLLYTIDFREAVC